MKEKINACLTSCRGCCKFLKDDTYFSPKFTDKEMKKISPKGKYKKLFQQFENSKKVFRISLIKSKNSKNVFVCPYLDEKTHICRIYKNRPFDCEFWPFIFIKHKNQVYIAHFKKNQCEITGKMNDSEFRKYVEASLKKFDREKVIKLIKDYPDLAWDPKKGKWNFKEDVFLFKKIK